MEVLLMENKEQDITDAMAADRKKAEDYILNYAVLKKEYELRKAEWLERSRPPVDTNTGGGKGNLPGHPVEDAAIKSAEYDAEHPEYLWLKAVGISLRTYGERKRIFITCRQEAERHNIGGRGRHGWVVYTQRRYCEEIENRFINTTGWLGERTIKAWWRQILDRIVEIWLRLK